MGISGVSKGLYRARMGFKYQTVYFLFFLFLLFLFTPTPPPLAHFLCSCLSVMNLSRCSLPVTYLAVVFFFPFLSIFRSLPPTPHALSSLVVSSHPFLPRTPHASSCFCWAALLSPRNPSPCQSHRGEFWTSGCCWVTAHGCSVFGAKSQRGSKADAKAFRFACGHYYKVKHLSPSSSWNIIYRLRLALLTNENQIKRVKFLWTK